MPRLAATDMDPRIRWAFLALIVAQAAHSIEEYVFRLFDVFAPARFVSGLVSDDLSVGFAFGNAGLVMFGLWSVSCRHGFCEVSIELCGAFLPKETR